MNADDETNITDIDLLADGRIFVFGTSVEVLAMLDVIQGGQDPTVRHRLMLREDVPTSRVSEPGVQRGNHD